MVPLPVLPVRAHFHNSSCLPLKPFACHISGKSPQSSTSSDAATTRLDIVLGRANPFALISFTDPHRLNSVVSYRYKYIGGRASSKTTAIHFDSLLGCANSFALNSFADPHPLTPVPSILYKKHGGGAKPFRCALCIPNTGRPSVPFHLPYLLPSSVSRNSCVCHSYENCRGVYQQFPKWNVTPHAPKELS